MESAQKNRFVLTAKETAEYLRLSEMTVLRLAAQGIIPGAKIGRQWRFERESVQMLIRDPEILRRVGLKKTRMKNLASTR
jgi:excisionase family DNA binding protein